MKRIPFKKLYFVIYASPIYEIFLRLLMFENNISPFALCIQGIISAERKFDSIKQISNTQDTRLLQQQKKPLHSR